MVRAARVLLAFLVVAAVGLAGCNALSGSDRSPSPVDTVTPVPVPNETTTSAAETSTPVGFDLPPGVRPNGTIDPIRLRRAHHRHLENRSYQFNITGETVSDSGLESYAYLVRVSSGSRFRGHFRNGDFHSDWYTNESVRYEREYDRRNDQWNISTDSRSVVDNRSYHARLMTSYMGEKANQIDQVTRNGSEYVRLFFSGIPTSEGSAFHESVSRYRVTAFVRPDGFVRLLVVTYEYRTNGERRQNSLRFEQSGFGTTTVETPAWVKRARHNATVDPARTTDSGSTPPDSRTASPTVTGE